MTTSTELLKLSLQSELINGILNYWMERTIDTKNGGFYGQISYNNIINAEADKGAIMHARILWTFASAYNLLKDERYLKIADYTYDYIKEHFLDKEYGGVFWMVDYKGNVVDDKKQVYANSFVIYAFAEYAKAAKTLEAKELALNIFDKIEEFAFDEVNNGYFEAYSREWFLLDDLRLSAKDMNEKKTNNTHLHVLEAYTTLYEVTKNEKVGKQLRNLIELFLNKILNPGTYHFKLFFDENWKLKSDEISYGHDIEGAWLLQEAAIQLGDQELLEQVKDAAVKIADVTIEEGIASDGAIINEGNPSGVTDTDRHWWPQVEAMVGFINAYENTLDEKYLDTAKTLWNYALINIVNHEFGEWWWRVDENNQPNLEEDKVGPWKAPYHNGRACIEGIKRIEKLMVQEQYKQHETI
ncbi:AGE family epimerase/isomerase [Flammeovirga kamogawensis]|uniref:Cellobiose 2-epimerase n=1 Tax=Flammeovirga kamogawensis TaxID=373891 RepID=A0ABX8H427_9BACT|nr:AGE family epimerase/isomerase [Flammeovirga kamogawensis]MBB6461726.1 mannobiose 2-epimerase [Flammeovirga kamogawensis]QWG10644.1 AGE family epimerase/isomerase [Flammeovirga kamogawensis]TRX63748.1 N-acyl-D-glucosamine 2-epimerase [Flammeovirga kamogawensis]